MAENTDTPKKKGEFIIRSLYFPKDFREILARYDKLASQHRGVSTSALVCVAMGVCIDELEKFVPSKRSFKLNDVAVEV